MHSLTRRVLALAALVLPLVVLGNSALAVDNFTPNPVVLTLPAGETATVKKTLHLDALPGAADIIIAIDTTGSMGSAIAQAKAQASQLCTDVQTAIPGARFAVFNFKDVLDPGYGPDGVLILTPVFTNSCAAVSAAVNTMSASGGGDFPEAYNWVFNNAYLDPTLDASRNPNAVQFLVVLGDAPPHNNPAPVVAPSCGIRPPADSGITSDSEIAALNANDITLLMIRYNNFIPLACYSELAVATGGTAVNAGADLSATIISQITAAAAQINSVVLSYTCAPAGPTITFSALSPTPPTTAPVDITFTETITAPTVPGTYACTVTATVDGTPRATQTVTLTVVAAAPATLTLTPATATNIVDTQHCVTATVTDAFGNPTPGVTVNFTVTGANSTSGSGVTDASGVATFCYISALPGSDTITATAVGGTNPTATAAKTWVVPTSTEGCKITDGGRISAANGDKATFGANAQAPNKGQQQYQDHGPAVDINVHSISITAVVCNTARTAGSIFGTATINGAGTFNFRIDVQDLGEPGTSDTYRIRLSNGYDSGVQVLTGGNIQIHK